MEVGVNYLAVLLAGLSTMVVGSIWYTPKVFGNIWMKMTGVKMGRKMTGMQTFLMFGGVFVASLISAYVLAHVAYLSHSFFGGNFLVNSLSTAFWLWLGFTATRIFTHDTFEGRRKKLTLLNVTHELVTFLVMALIIGVFGVPA